MIRLNLCDYSETYILVQGTITVPNTAAAGSAVNNTDKKVIFKNCAPYTDCIAEINNTQSDDAQKIDVVMLMYKLIDYSGAYSKTSGSLWQYYRDEPVININDEIINFPANNSNSASFKFKQQDKQEEIEIMVLLKYLSNFWRALVMPLINCELIN